LSINGVLNPKATEDSDYHATIYSASYKHNFSDDLMAYVSTGTSWRPGIAAVGDFNLNLMPQEQSFLNLAPEKSTSYEVGFKASALDKRLKVNVDVYHQKFDNFVYRSGGGAYYASTDRNTRPPFVPTNVETVKQFNFVAAVPAEVNGVEGDISFTPIPTWDVGAVASYAYGKIKNGFVPCNDYAPTDGIPDGAKPATPADIHAATGGDNVAGCVVNYRASSAPLWSGSIQSEYRLPLTDTLTSFARGLLSVYGDSLNDPSNSNDDYDKYAMLNLYLGVRAPDSKWEVSLYGKNVTNTERVLARGATTLTASPNGSLASTNYYGGVAGNGGIAMTAPREFGLNVRYAFGSK
jgi:iron complex outermembrane receptor protein